MRKSRWVTLTILAVSVGVFTVLGAAAARAASAGKTASPGKAAVAAARGNMIFGQVESVNTDGKLLTIKAKEKEVEVGWTDATTLAWKAGREKPQAATVADLKAGERVSVRAEKGADGKLTAQSIWIRKDGEHQQSTAPGK